MLGHHTLKPNPGSRKKKKRVGRGDGSGSGNYCGRGMNGQGARTGKKLKQWFEGGQTPMVQRMPQLKGFKNINYVDYQVVNIEKIAKHFKSGEKINGASLAEKNLVKKADKLIKILGTGEIDFAVEITTNLATKSAKEKIEKAGGKIVVIEKK